jgi:hypothetical protein
MFIGYPWLIVIAATSAARWNAGRLDRPGQVAAVWATYLGLILVLHGIVICFDTALAGASPTAAEKRFGTWLAYLGGAVAGVGAATAYAIDLRRRSRKKETAKPLRLDDAVS